MTNETVRAAYVIARRDFTALVRSKAFVFFLLTPIVMLAVALAAGSVGAHLAADAPPPPPILAIAMDKGDTAQIVATSRALGAVVDNLPEVEAAPPGAMPVETLVRRSSGGRHYGAVLSGSLSKPVLTTTSAGQHIWSARTRLLIDTARRKSGFRDIPLAVRTITVPSGSPTVDRRRTAQLGQMALFLSTMLLAGMVLSNLVEEKANKIVEILAASIPLEAIFLGKLFAMLAMAMIAIAVWAGFGLAVTAALGAAMPVVPPPAVGWPLFVLLGGLYFSTAYLLLGSLYLGIGAVAATVRDVQTLSMPVSMGQLAIFLLASYTMARPGSPLEIAACIIPFSSPFALLARAAETDAIWPHVFAVIWQCIWTWAIIMAGTRMFRRNVLKSKRSTSRRPDRDPKRPDGGLPTNR